MDGNKAQDMRLILLNKLAREAWQRFIIRAARREWALYAQARASGREVWK